MVLEGQSLNMVWGGECLELEQGRASGVLIIFGYWFGWFHGCVQFKRFH